MESRRRQFVYRLGAGLCLGLLLLDNGALSTAQSDETFDTWLKTLKTQALSLGIRPQTLDAVWTTLRFQPLVIELDRKQPERTLTYAQYLDRVLPPSRIRRGAQRLQEHRAVLRDIGAEYGVPPRVIVALWGIESDFGRHMGNFPVLSSLATLAYEGRRGAFFRREFFAALRIVNDGHIQPQDMVGSWAGAMGQSQFLPSSFQRYAVDFNGDGRRDIWKTVPDVFASMANYLKGAGWERDETWGLPVTLPSGFDLALSDLDITKTLTAWQAHGVRRLHGDDLPTSSLSAALILPDGLTGPAFLVYHNYRVLLKWNRSHYFATTVGQFADRLKE